MVAMRVWHEERDRALVAQLRTATPTVQNTNEALLPGHPGLMEDTTMAPHPRPGWPGTLLVVGALLGGGIAVAGPAHAGSDEFLNDINSVGIGNRDDPHNFDLVGFGNAICWRLYTGEAPAQIADSVFANSRTGKQANLTHDQSDAAVRFAHADLCPDAAPKS